MKSLCQFKLQKSIRVYLTISSSLGVPKWMIGAHQKFLRARSWLPKTPICQSRVLLYCWYESYVCGLKVHHPKSQVVCGAPKVPLKVSAFSSVPARAHSCVTVQVLSPVKKPISDVPVSTKDWFSTALACEFVKLLSSSSSKIWVMPPRAILDECKLLPVERSQKSSLRQSCRSVPGPGLSWSD